MAWGRRNTYSTTERAPPVAFTGSGNRRNDQSFLIRHAIARLEDKQVKLALQDFDHEELKLLFVDPAHRETLTKAWALVEPSGSTQELHVKVTRPEHAERARAQNVGIYVVFTWHRHNCEHCFYVPHLAGASQTTAVHPRVDAPHWLRDRFEQACADLLDVHWRFAQVEKVFSRLNTTESCKTPAQMRYVWPCIQPLCRLAGLHGIAGEIEQPSERAGANVRVPPEIMPLLHPTNDTIARAMFLQDAPLPAAPSISYVMAHGFINN